MAMENGDCMTPCGYASPKNQMEDFLPPLFNRYFTISRVNWTGTQRPYCPEVDFLRPVVRVDSFQKRASRRKTNVINTPQMVVCRPLCVARGPLACTSSLGSGQLSPTETEMPFGTSPTTTTKRSCS